MLAIFCPIRTAWNRFDDAIFSHDTIILVMHGISHTMHGGWQPVYNYYKLKNITAMLLLLLLTFDKSRQKQNKDKINSDDGPCSSLSIGAEAVLSPKKGSIYCNITTNIRHD